MSLETNQPGASAADPHIRAAFYLSPTLDAWWRWADDARALTWADGRTIAFMPEVEAVLGRLAPGGLPPFGAVALVLAACRDGWADSPGRSSVVGYARAFGGIATTADGGGAQPAGPRRTFARVARDAQLLVDGLDAVAALPPDLRTPTDARLVLVETVFEGAANRGTPADAALVVAALSDGVRAATLRPQLTVEEALGQFARQVDGLAGGLARVDAARLARRARTGLDDEIAKPADDLSPPERVRRLLAELRSDPALSGIARLASDLMAAVAVPRSLRSREELPMGGVSDLTNRGPLDRLLVSELAHDDLTLAVRVAVNEALYLRRESPPREPPHARAILIDAGVRTWGVPRAFCAAVALALSATGDPTAELRVFRAAAGGRVAPVDLTTRAGLEAHLAALESAAHPGASLADFLAAANATAGPNGAPTDAFVLTHADAAADPEFVAAARAVGMPLLYVAAVDRDGAFRLTARTPAGARLVREARLSLDALTRPAKPSRPSAPLIDRRAAADLPAIFSAEPFPLLLHHRADPKATVVSAEFGMATVTADGRLLHWKGGPHEGATQLLGSLPPGRVIARGLSHDGRRAYFATALSGAHDVRVVVAGLAGGGGHRVASTDHDTTGRRAAFFVGQHLCVVRRGTVDVFDVESEPVRHVGTVGLPPGCRWVGGRFFNGPWSAGWRMLTATSLLALEPVGPWTTVMMFEREGHEGPLSLLSDGKVVDSAARVVGHVPGWSRQCQWVGTSVNGSHVAFRDGPKGFIHNLGDEQARPVPVGRGFEEEALLAPHIYASTRSWMAPRTKFSAINLTADLLPALVRRVAYVPAASGKSLRLERPAANLLSEPGPKFFADVPRGGPTRVKLRLATWADGSRAWLDARGLLHLRSSDLAIPEVTITLMETGGAAWSSDGKVCGPRYNVGADATPTDAAYFIELMRQFGQRLR